MPIYTRATLVSVPVTYTCAGVDTPGDIGGHQRPCRGMEGCAPIGPALHHRPEQQCEKTEKTMSRTFTCTCAQSLTGADDEWLLREAREHFDKLHPDRPLTEAQLRDLLSRETRDQGGGAAPGTSNIEVKDTPN